MALSYLELTDFDDPLQARAFADFVVLYDAAFHGDERVDPATWPRQWARDSTTALEDRSRIVLYGEMKPPPKPAPKARAKRSTGTSSRKGAAASETSAGPLPAHDADGRLASARFEVWGGTVFEYLSHSRTALLSYMVVAENHRQQGVARALVQAIQVRLATIAGFDAEGTERLRGLFFEAVDPVKLEAADSSTQAAEHAVMDPWHRVRAWTNLGARGLQLDYHQPPVSAGGGWVPHFALFVLPYIVHAEEMPRPGLDTDINDILGADPPCVEFDYMPKVQTTPEVVMEFLVELYRAMSVPDAENHKHIVAARTRLERDGIVYREFEFPNVRFWKSSFTFHAALRRLDSLASCGVAERESEPLYSYEADLLSYQHQFAPPFQSALQTSAPVGLVLRFPREIAYRSEGASVVTVAREIERRCEATLTRTQFDLGLADIWHLTLAPAPGSFFHEFDAIKFVSMFDGIQEASDLYHGARVEYVIDEAGTATPEARAAIRLVLERVLRPNVASGAIITGTTTACTMSYIPEDKAHDKSIDWKELLTLLHDAAADSDDEEAKTRLETAFWGNDRPSMREREEASAQLGSRRHLSAIATLVNGIFDQRLEFWEFLDTIAGHITHSDDFGVVHRASVTHLCHGDEILTWTWPWLKISPYVLLPNSVFMHNEAILRELHKMWREPHAELGGVGLEAWQRSLVRESTLEPCRDEIYRLLLNTRVRAESLLLGFYDEALFQYKSEKDCLRQLMEHRGQFRRQALAMERLRTLATIIADEVELRRAGEREAERKREAERDRQYELEREEGRKREAERDRRREAERDRQEEREKSVSFWIELILFLMTVIQLHPVIVAFKADAEAKAGFANRDVWVPLLALLLTGLCTLWYHRWKTEKMTATDAASHGE